jgi:pimeloyl-ACP methyl ester carboxylesterase
VAQEGFLPAAADPEREVKWQVGGRVRCTMTRPRPLPACALAALLASAPALAGEPDLSCLVGTYRFPDGSFVDVGPAAPGHLRWRRADGTNGELTPGPGGTWSSTLGWTGRPDGRELSFGSCPEGTLRFDGETGRRIAFDVAETRFAGAGVSLAGRLLLPPGKGKVPIVVLVHGSEHDSALTFYALQRLLPAEGIGAFVYDKRGTGASGGSYTQNYLLLADDAIAAAREARRLAGARAGRLGYWGGSQGGWVAPLAARIEPVDFVVVAWGLAVSPAEEDRAAVALDVTRRGLGPEVLAKALEVADATGAVLAGDGRTGFDRVEAVRRKYGAEPWFRLIRGNVTYLVLEKTPAEFRELAAQAFPGAPVQHDPMPVLRNLRIPQLWLLGEDDLDAPSAETARRLRALAADGLPIQVKVFPRAEHGLYEYEEAADGTRTSTRQAAGYFPAIVSFVRGGKR